MLAKTLLGALAVLAGVSAQPKKPADDLEKLQGNWRVIAVRAGPDNKDHELNAKNRFVFDGTKVTQQDQFRAPQAEFKLGKDGDTRTIDVTFAERGKEHTLLGVYEFDGDRLRVAYAIPGDPRPTFTPKANEKVLRFVLRRETKDDDKLLAKINDGSALARMLLDQGDHKAAEKQLRTTIDQAVEFYGPRHSRVGALLSLLGDALGRGGNYVEAEEVLTKALAISETEYHPDHPAIEIVTNNLGMVCTALADYERAEKLLKRSLESREKTGGKTSHEYAISLENLAEVYVLTGDYRKAEPMYAQALEIMEKKHGKTSPHVGLVLNGFGVLRKHQGRFEEAEQLLTRARAIWEKNPGPQSVEMAKVLNNLATLYERIGALERAEQYATDSVTILEKRHGKSHPDVATARNNLAMIQFRLGRIKEAREELGKSINAYTETLGPNHFALAKPLFNRAVLERNEGNLDRANADFRRALKLFEDTLGPDHPETALVRVESASAVALTGDVRGALRLANQGIAAYRAKLSPDHLVLAKGLEVRALLLIISGQPDAARTDLLESLTIQESNLRRVFAFVDEQTMYQLALEAAPAVELFPLVVNGKPVAGDDARAVYEWVLRRKGVVLEAVSRYRRARPLLDADRELAAKAERWRAVRQQIADLPLRKGIDPAEVKVRLAKLSDEAATLEGELNRAVTDKLGVGGYDPKVSLVDQVRRKLRPGEVLVEFKAWEPFVSDPDPAKWLGERRYVAFVLTADAKFPLRVVDLGSAAAIDTAIAALRHPFGDGGSKWDTKEAAYQELARSVFDLLFGKLSAELAGAKTLLVAPDGVLNLVPFATLYDGKQYLIQRYRFACLTGGRDLLRPAAKTGTGVTIFSRPDYQKPGVLAAANPQPVAPRPGPARPPVSVSPQVRGDWEKPLDDVQEAEDIVKALTGSKLGEVTVHTGTVASEEQLKAITTPPRILHFITHGFYVETQPESKRRLGPTSKTETRLRATDNPFLRSGIVLAGAAKPLDATKPADAKREDGVITAEEIALLNLTGTELVVLSACETGLGEVTKGARTTEGVQGVRQAFLVAGAQSVVVTLWKIPNTPETARLMKRFYAHLAAGLEPAEALQRAQLDLLTSTDPAEKTGKHPYYWGSYLLVGCAR